MAQLAKPGDYIPYLKIKEVATATSFIFYSTYSVI